MVVNALSTDKRNDMMKKGLCFNCNKASYAPSPTTSKRMNPKELVAHIRSITAQMGLEEKRNFLMKQKKRVFKEENHIDIDLSCT